MDYDLLLEHYMRHLLIPKDDPRYFDSFSDEETATLNRIGLRIWPASNPTDPIPDKPRMPIWYLVDQYPKWNDPYPQPISNHRDFLTNRVDRWLIWTYMMLTHHIRPSFEDAIPRGKPIYFGPNINPQDTILTDAAKESIKEAADYWPYIMRLFIDELNGDYEVTKKVVTDLYTFITKDLGLIWKPLDINYNEDQIMRNDGWRFEMIDRIGLELYPHPRYENSPELNRILKDLMDPQLAKIRQNVHNCRWFGVGQAYNDSSRGAWRNTKSLIELQLMIYEYCIANGCEELGWFNLDRELGGSLHIPGMIDVHDEIRRRIWS